MSDSPNIFLLIGTQVCSVIGDAWGQRVSRKRHGGSRRRFMSSLAIVTSLQVLLILGIIQMVLPSDIVSAVYVNRKKIRCYKEIDYEGFDMHCNDETCDRVSCVRQGPGSALLSILLHPLLLLNGVLGILYYVGEAMLYRHPLALIIIVLAALSSAFLILPFASLLNVEGGKATPLIVVVLGIIGSILCVLEIRRKSDDGEEETEHGDRETVVLLEGSGNENLEGVKKYETRRRLRRIVSRSCSIFIPFLLLSFTYALWFVIQRYFNDHYHLNVYGYTSVDQGLLPLYVLTFFLVIDMFPLLHRNYDDGEDKKYSTWENLSVMFRELHIFDTFIYRLIINFRAMVYFYLAIQYDLNRVYLQLTLIRIVLSWMGALFLVVVLPKVIAITEEEKKRVLYIPNIIVRLLGTLLITFSIVLLRMM